MTTVLDIQALQAAAGIRIPLAENVWVRSGSVTSESVQGFSDVRAVELVVRVPVLRGHPAPSVSVTVESSVNGSDWTTGHAFTFTATGDDSFTLDAPDDYLRVVCAPAGGLREAVVSVVASIVTVDAPGGGGGGSQPITRAIYNLARSSVPANAGRKLDWSYSAGDALLDLTDPQNPVPVASGVYAVSFFVAPSAVVGAAAVMEADLEIDGNNLDPIMTNVGPMNAGGFTAVVGVSLTYYCPNNTYWSAQVRHSDAGQSPDMSGQAFVQRLS